MESTESRFAHLLKPIRELTKNWEIDVASELNDYLEELDEMCITFDGGKTRLNFAEAALVIQGTTCIYSKKVELLYNLVYQTLEYINDKNKKKNKQAAAESQEDDADGAADNHSNDEAVFTNLDINASNNLQKGESTTTVSVIPLPPESLIPPETREKHKLPLVSLKGEILCSQKDFRINIFIPENNMILLMAGSAESRIRMEHNQQHADFVVEKPTQRDDVPGDAGVATADAAEDNFLLLEDNDMELDHEIEEHTDRQQAPSEGRMIRERRPVESNKPKEKELPPAVDLWALQDQYAALVEDKPFKSGKCYKVPEGLDDRGKRKRKHPSSFQDFRKWFKIIIDPPVHKLKNGPTFVDLNYIYLTTLKDKLKSKRRILRTAGGVISDEELRRALLQPEATELQWHGEDDNSDNEQEGFPEDIPAEFDGGPDFISPEAGRDDLTYEQLVKMRIEQLVVNSQGYTQETALSRRVKDWEDKIRPILALQEEQPVFDIHNYGDRIVDAFNHVGQRRSFASIVSGLDNFEACKYLLASLQLANDYTVAIDSVVGLEKSVDSMGLTLLSVHRATDRFKNLHAENHSITL